MQEAINQDLLNKYLPRFKKSDKIRTYVKKILDLKFFLHNYVYANDCR